MVGAATADDAGVYKISDELALIQTVDFFTPIVNDPYTFGQIAAVNALSDVYAMGGVPICAMNVCCFPLKGLPPEALGDILRGGLDKVHEAGAALAGGHTVEDPELKYGLSVTGLVHPERIVTNAGLTPGQRLILTKPLGTGVIATALKGGLASQEALDSSVAVMCQLNAAAAQVMAELGVTGATDVTGFGLLGHSLELARASGVGLVIEAQAVPILPQAQEMAAMGLVPVGSHANKDYCAGQVSVSGPADEILYDLLADAQTSGGLLMGVDPGSASQALEMLAARGVQAAEIGHVIGDNPGTIKVRF